MYEVIRFDPEVQDFVPYWDETEGWLLYDHWSDAIAKCHALSDKYPGEMYRAIYYNYRRRRGPRSRSSFTRMSR